MARPRRDGAASRQPNKRNLTELYVKRIRPQASVFNVWDAKERGLVLKVQPSGVRSFFCVYRFHGRPRWYCIGSGVPLSDARRIAVKIKLAALEGKDPVAERRAERGVGTFAELAERYLSEWAMKKNRSWKQADYL